MDAKSEVREFLTSRRGRITPTEAGLPVYGDKRRVPGLRREEVAMLAGVSVDYYTRLERGNLSGVSESVLLALANALRLDDAEQAHLFDLARAASTTIKAKHRSPRPRIRPGVQRLLDAIMDAPAFVRNGRMDILAANRVGAAFYSEMMSGSQPPNTARFVFLDPRSKDFYIDWDRVSNDAVAILRSQAGHDPYDRELSDLVGELSTQSELFRVLWAKHNVRFHHTGTKRFHHPIVGDIDLDFETMQLSADQGLTLFAYTAEPGSKSEQALQLLSAWTATPQEHA